MPKRYYFFGMKRSYSKKEIFDFILTLDENIFNESLLYMLILKTCIISQLSDTQKINSLNIKFMSIKYVLPDKFQKDINTNNISECLMIEIFKSDYFNNLPYEEKIKYSTYTLSYNNILKIYETNESLFMEIFFIIFRILVY